MITIEQIKAARTGKFPINRMQARYFVLDFAMQHHNLKSNLPPGLVLEFGVDSGATINFIAREFNYSFTPQRIYGFDSFEGLPEDWIQGFPKGKFDRQGVPPPVHKNVFLHIGLFEQTLPRFVQTHSEHVSFLHIDCDIYSSTDFVLRTLEGKIVPGTIIVFDELAGYKGYEEHEFKAFNEFLERTGLGCNILIANQYEQVAVEIIGGNINP